MNDFEHNEIFFQHNKPEAAIYWHREAFYAPLPRQGNYFLVGLALGTKLSHLGSRLALSCVERCLV